MIFGKLVRIEFLINGESAELEKPTKQDKEGDRYSPDIYYWMVEMNEKDSYSIKIELIDESKKYAAGMAIDGMNIIGGKRVNEFRILENWGNKFILSSDKNGNGGIIDSWRDHKLRPNVNFVVVGLDEDCCFNEGDKNTVVISIFRSKEEDKDMYKGMAYEMFVIKMFKKETNIKAF